MIYGTRLMAALSAKCYSPQPATPTPCLHVSLSSGSAFQHAEELLLPLGQDHADLRLCWTVPPDGRWLASDSGSVPHMQGERGIFRAGDL